MGVGYDVGLVERARSQRRCKCPSPPRTSAHDARFGVFEFDETTLELVKSGRAVSLRPQPLKLLALLLARPGELVSRDSLQRALWDGDTFVDFEQGVNHAIRELGALRSATRPSRHASSRRCPNGAIGSSLRSSR